LKVSPGTPVKGERRPQRIGMPLKMIRGISSIAAPFREYPRPAEALHYPPIDPLTAIITRGQQTVSGSRPDILDGRRSADHLKPECKPEGRHFQRIGYPADANSGIESAPQLKGPRAIRCPTSVAKWRVCGSPSMVSQAPASSQPCGSINVSTSESGGQPQRLWSGEKTKVTDGPTESQPKFRLALWVVA